MDQKNSQLKIDIENNILCSKHNIPANNICLEKDCKHIINCIQCSLKDKHKHPHTSNINLNDLLNGKMENKIYEDDLLNDEKKILEVKSELKKIKKIFLENFEKMEENIIREIKEKNFNKIILKKKKYFEKIREIFKKDNRNLTKLKKLAEIYINFTKTKNLKKFSKYEKFISEIKSKITLQNKNFEKILKNHEQEFSLKIQKNFFQNSKLITNYDICFINKNLFKKKIKSTNLIYRGSENGFTSSQFINKCNNRSKLLILIKSEFNQIFGGFFSGKLNNFDKFCFSEKSFLFSLDRKKKFLQKKNCKKTFKFFTSENQIFAFGGGLGNDLCVYNNCDLKKYSISYFGNSFVLPEGVGFNSEESKSYLAGGYYYKVLEIEVFEMELDGF